VSDVIEWFLLDDDIRVLATGLVTVVPDTAGNFLPVQDLGPVPVMAEGAPCAVLYRWRKGSVPEQRNENTIGVLLPLSSGYVKPGNTVTLTWTKGLFWSLEKTHGS
jgi:hypothetical protein